MNKLISLSCLLASLVVSLSSPAADVVRLDGSWRFQLDRSDRGVTERWFEKSLPDKINLPGSLPAQGIGDAPSLDTKWTGGIVDRSWFTAPEFEKYRQPGNVKVPFWLQPEKYYTGAAWFQRAINIPADWQGKRVVLSLERPHWETRVWVDGQFIGTNNALATPHDYDLGPLAPGRHTLTLRVDNRMVIDVGENSHSVSDHTQGNWNGIVGNLLLRARAPAWIDDLQVYPHLATKSVTIRGRIGNVSGQAGQGTVRLVVDEAVERGAFVGPPFSKINVSWQAGGGTFEHEFKLPGEPKLWDEFQQHLYNCEARLEEFNERKVALFGFREITTQGTQFLVNGRKTFFRGTLECAIFPKTGHPPVDLDGWRKVIRAAKAHGLNNLRFHSWCPPEAAFVAADELGMYLHVEASSWANQSTTIGDGKPVDQWIYDETDRILKYYGNHPSFVLMPYGNEPGGRHHAAYLAKWVSHFKAKDPRRLWTSGAGWPQLPENQWHSTPDPRIQAWGGGLKNRINARPPETRTDYRDYVSKRTVPVISHEIGQWCVYPNFDEMKKYTGYLKPKNFEIFRDLLQAHGLGAQAKQFLLASGKLQTLCYKEDIESALRTPGMGGFQLLDLHDFPGQGTALVGVLDPFWESKGYVTPEEYSRFCNGTVPLARLSKRVFTPDETLQADLEVAHFGPAPLENVATAWKLVREDGKTVVSGNLPTRSVPVDNCIPLGSLSLELKSLPAPARYKLVLTVGQASRLSPSPSRNRRDADPTFENDWDLWVYPPKVETPPPAGVKIVEELNDDALATLDAGGKVLLLIPPKQVKNAAKDKVALGFSSIFWNTAWTHRQAPTTLGILCDPKHPALADFPTDSHSNWQWWYLVTRAGAMILDDLPRSLRPTVQVIDDWFTAHKLALVFEGKLRQGRLLVCSIDLQTDLDANPVARQMRASLLRYMSGAKFKPSVELTVEQVRGLIGEPPVLKSANVKSIKASSAEAGYEAENALDGDPNTMWHSQYTGDKPGFPHELDLELKQPLILRGFTALPRQDRNKNGWIKGYACFVSHDGQAWGEPVAKGEFSADAKLKTVSFAQPQTARFLRLVALSGHASSGYGSLAELDLLETGK
ncbi:MAG: discoidin domain-containing protein [Verrucomicrobia bacterium]|nr:discoidin domain-containing protein [Verrucomicrobiota bacterium]